MPLTRRKYNELRLFMFASDRNIDTIERLVQLVKNYIGLQKEYVKLDIIDKSVRLLTALILFVVIAVILLGVLTYASFAVFFALAPTFGYPLSFTMIAAFYFLVFILFLIFKKTLIERPLVRFLAKVLMDK